MRTEKQFSVFGVVGKWMCLAGLAGMTAMFAVTIVAPHAAASVAPATVDTAVVATFVMFTLGFCIWVFEPEAARSRLMWKRVCLLALTASGVPLGLLKLGVLPATFNGADVGTAVMTWLSLCLMLAIVAARRWRTLADTYAAASRWVTPKTPTPGTKGSAAGDNGLASAVAFTTGSASAATVAACVTMPPELAIMSGINPAMAFAFGADMD